MRYFGFIIIDESLIFKTQNQFYNYETHGKLVKLIVSTNTGVSLINKIINNKLDKQNNILYWRPHNNNYTVDFSKKLNLVGNLFLLFRKGQLTLKTIVYL